MSDAQAAYDQEQEKLRKEHEGDPDLRIEAPKLPEVNPELLQDVEPLLFKGFVYASAEINGIPFVFKSLNQHEWELLGFTATGAETGRKALRRHYNNFLAYGVLMVEGVNILPRRDEYLPQIAEMFASMPEGAHQKVVREMSEVNRRATRAVWLAEVFALETKSRFRWAQVAGLDLTSTAVTGIAGTDTLGLNFGQLLWRAVNYYEDIRDRMEREWEHAKFIASATAGKEIQKVHNSDRRRRETELAEQQKRRDKILRFTILGEPMDDDKPMQGHVKVARTVDELADQLERDLRGEKDFHDSVVDAHEQQVRTNYQRRQDTLQTYRDNFSEKWGDLQTVGGTELGGLSPQDVAKRLEQKRQAAAKRLAAPQVAGFPELMDPRQEGFMEKWAQRSQLPPVSGPVGRPVAPVEGGGPRGLPFKRGE